MDNEVLQSYDEALTVGARILMQRVSTVRGFYFTNIDSKDYKTLSLLHVMKTWAQSQQSQIVVKCGLFTYLKLLSTFKSGIVWGFKKHEYINISDIFTPQVDWKTLWETYFNG